MSLSSKTTGLALFLDVDGTLVEFADRPENVRVPPSLTQLIKQLTHEHGGAVALLSGRTITNLDELFDGNIAAVAGVHGLERRRADGTPDGPEPEPIPAATRQAIHRLADIDPGILIEDKQHGIAVHFRQAAEHQDILREHLTMICAELGDHFDIQAGKMVFELREHTADKGSALLAFMDEQPFANRLPVFIGDDVTDEDGFAAVNGLDGISIRVGHETEPTLANYYLPDVPAVHEWLRNPQLDELTTRHQHAHA